MRMARFTLLEVHLDGSQFTANAPFSGEESREGAREAVTERLGRESETEDSESSPMGIAVGLVLLVGAAAVARRYLSRRESDGAEAQADEPIVAD